IQVPKQTCKRVSHYALYIVRTACLVDGVNRINILQVCCKNAGIPVEAHKLYQLRVKGQDMLVIRICKCIIHKAVIVGIRASHLADVLSFVIHTAYLYCFSPVENICTTNNKRIAETGIAEDALNFPKSH